VNRVLQKDARLGEPMGKLRSLGNQGAHIRLSNTGSPPWRDAGYAATTLAELTRSFLDASAHNGWSIDPASVERIRAWSVRLDKEGKAAIVREGRTTSAAELNAQVVDLRGQLARAEAEHAALQRHIAEVEQRLQESRRAAATRTSGEPTPAPPPTSAPGAWVAVLAALAAALVGLVCGGVGGRWTVPAPVAPEASTANDPPSPIEPSATHAAPESSPMASSPLTAPEGVPSDPPPAAPAPAAKPPPEPACAAGTRRLQARAFKLRQPVDRVKWPKAERLIVDVAHPSLCFDEQPVSADEYAACVTAGACMQRASTCRASEGGAPANCVSHAQAETYCQWRGAVLVDLVAWEDALRQGIPTHPDADLREWAADPYPAAALQRGPPTLVEGKAHYMARSKRPGGAGGDDSVGGWEHRSEAADSIVGFRCMTLP
jgi:hypothetical protein